MTKKKILSYIIVLLQFFVVIWIVTAIFRVGDYKDKLWAHRVNSLEKRMEFQNSFPNFEVDITIRIDSSDGDAILDVTHDEDTTFGLTFDEYIPISVTIRPISVICL